MIIIIISRRGRHYCLLPFLKRRRSLPADDVMMAAKKCDYAIASLVAHVIRWRHRSVAAWVLARHGTVQQSRRAWSTLRHIDCTVVTHFRFLRRCYSCCCRRCRTGSSSTLKTLRMTSLPVPASRTPGCRSRQVVAAETGRWVRRLSYPPWWRHKSALNGRVEQSHSWDLWIS